MQKFPLKKRRKIAPDAEKTCIRGILISYFGHA